MKTNRDEMQTLETLPGDHIDSACERLVALANETGAPAQMQFNDVTVTANVGDDPAVLAGGFMAECKRRALEYAASPEGLAAAERARLFAEQAAASAAEGIKPFAVRDPAAWEQCVAVNTDGYGACTVRYAARWAHLMERDLAQGQALADIADPTSHEADTEGITGFMYGCAVSILAQVWEHGETLRRWHNVKSQIRDEGDRANESGGVLNPALLTVSER